MRRSAIVFIMFGLLLITMGSACSKRANQAIFDATLAERHSAAMPAMDLALVAARDRQKHTIPGSMQYRAWEIAMEQIKTKKEELLTHRNALDRDPSCHTPYTKIWLADQSFEDLSTMAMRDSHKNCRSQNGDLLILKVSETSDLAAHDQFCLINRSPPELPQFFYGFYAVQGQSWGMTVVDY